MPARWGSSRRRATLPLEYGFGDAISSSILNGRRRILLLELALSEGIGGNAGSTGSGGDVDVFFCSFLILVITGSALSKMFALFFLKFPINNDIVKPTPERIATPIMSMKLVFLGRSARLNLILMYENKDTPTVFPTKRDKAILNAKEKSITTSLET